MPRKTQGAGKDSVSRDTTPARSLPGRVVSRPSFLGIGSVVIVAGAALITRLGSVTDPAEERAAGGHWKASSCENLPALEPGALTHFREAVPASELALVHAAQTEARKQAHRLDYERSFGYEAVGVKGHNVTFLHTVFLNVAPGLAHRLHCLTLSAQQSRGWGLDDVADQLQPRTVELITYDAAGEVEADSNLGWHSDLGSVLTTALTLSSRSSFDGGVFEVRQGADQAVSQVLPGAGDVLVWRGWDPHRVAPVTRGRRQVLVLEWWLGPANEDPGLLRGIKASAAVVPHKAKSYELAVKVDPTNPIAQLNLASHQADEMKDFEQAEMGLRRALELAPAHAGAHLKLGRVLQRKGRAADALQELRAASALEPTSADFALVAAVTAFSGGDAQGFEQLMAAAQLAPDKAKTRFTVAAALASSSRISEARHHLSEALVIDPAHTEALALDISLGSLELTQDNDASDGVAQPKAISMESIDVMRVAELKHELGRLGLSRTGSRETLRERLRQALQSSEPE